MYYAEAAVPFEISIRRELTNPYKWHQAVWEAFAHHNLPSPVKREREQGTRPFLTRHDLLPSSHRVLILSRFEPRRPGWCPENGWRCKTIPPSYFEASLYDFSLIANPVKRDRKNGKRAAIRNKTDVETWIHSRGKQGGFSIEGEPTIKFLKPARFLKDGTGNNRPLTLHQVRFEGQLTVTSSETFQQTMLDGIGSAKGFGMGLLLAIPRKEPIH